MNILYLLIFTQMLTWALLLVFAILKAMIPPPKSPRKWTTDDEVFNFRTEPGGTANETGTFEWDVETLKKR